MLALIAIVALRLTIVALRLTISRGGVAASAAAVQRAVWVAVIAIVAKAGHFAEEFATGLHVHRPAVFSLVTWASASVSTA